MTAAELLYRLRQQFNMLSLRIQHFLHFGIAKPPSSSTSFEFCRGRAPRLPPLDFDLARLEQAAESVLQGEISIAGHKRQWTDKPDIWHRAPDTARVWPRCFFGRIDYREGNPTGDIRQVWEPARLQQLVNLAVIARKTGAKNRERAIRLIRAQLLSWVEQNPPLSGPHYISAMECSLRLIATCHALDMVRPELRDETAWLALTRLVASHAPMIEQRLSLHSSTGNHTVAEAAGLTYAGILFPEFKPSKRWLRTGVALLSETANTQVLPDGGGTEQAIHYHLFNLQVFSLVHLLLEQFGEETPAEIISALDRGRRFLGALEIRPGQFPTIGDSDGGYALSQYHRLNVTPDGTTNTVHTFNESGYTVATICQTPNVQLVFDHGPLGMPPAYGHGHADALSIFLSVDGHNLLVDPGTYTYLGNPEWRCYFRGTAAHNTVTVNGNDQAKQAGCFIWARPFTTRLIDAYLKLDDIGRVIAEHDGYRNYGIRHVRGVAWHQNQWLLVWDWISGQSAHDLALHWHIQGQAVKLQDTEVDIRTSDSTFLLNCEGGQITEHFGNRDPIIGWQSPRYGIIKPIITLKISRYGALPHAFTTIFTLPGGQLESAATEDALNWMKARAN
jgi:hypothetical protein